MRLLEDTYTLVDQCELTASELADRAGVKLDWLNKFKQRAIAEPGVSKVESLYRFLSEHSAPSRNSSVALAGKQRSTRRSGKAQRVDINPPSSRVRGTLKNGKQIA